MEKLITIEVVKGPEKGKVFHVPESGFSIGRSTEPAEVTCALMADVSVSRRHAVGRVEGDRVVLEDWPGHPSKTGLVVDGRRAPAVSLALGGTVTVGRSVLAFRKPGQTRGFRLKVPPVWKRWLGVLGGVVLLVGGAAAVAPARGPVSAPVPAATVCGSELEMAAVELRQAAPAEAGAGRRAVRREERRYEKLFETPRRLEASLRLDEARDSWVQVALDMRADDPMRAWVETGCVARLNRQIAELRP